MARYRRYKRFYTKKNKWSIEQRPGFIAGDGWSTAQDTFLNRQALIPIVQATQQEGVRKAKNISVSLTAPGSANAPYYWALIYLPEGMAAQELRSTGQLYQPSQYVINSGIVTATEGKMRISSRLSRNLNQGDAIYLIIGGYSGNIPTGAANRFNYLVRYAICYN